MNIYSSHLIKTEDMQRILKDYSIGIEIVNFASAIVLDDKKNKLREFKDDMKGYLNRPVSLHGPFVDMSPGSPDRRIREITKERFQESYEIARELKAEHIIFHSGFIPKVSYDKEWAYYSKDFWNEFLEDKLFGDIIILLENVFDDDYLLLREIIDYVNNPIFSICFDIGHKNVCSTKSVKDWIEGLGNRIGYVHLHNNNGQRDSHCPLEEGTVQISEALSLLKVLAPEADWSLEIFSEEGIRASLEYLRKMDYL